MLSLRKEETRVGAADLVGTWDCHVHIFGPYDRYPLSANRRYSPPPAGTCEALAHGRKLGVGHLVLVQPSPYGTDNRCLLDALAEIGPSARGVVAIDPTEINDKEIAKLHKLGVRGVRVNPQGRIRAASIAKSTIRQLAERLAGTGWHIEFNCEPSVALQIGALCHDLDLRVIYDHVFGLDPAQPDFDLRSAEAVTLAKREQIWTKLSGFDRVCTRAAHWTRLASTIQALTLAAPNRLVWGSDWPHTPLPDTSHRITAFRSVDIAGQFAWLTKTLGEEGFRLVTRENPNTLYK